MKFDTNTSLVYLIDDEIEVRDSMMVLIESAGLHVKSFDSAQAFLNNYDSSQPGCLILDLKMPLMSGLELQEELVVRNINIPIIFISGNANIPDTAKAFRTGAIDFLEKPFTSQILFERIDEAINKDIEIRNNLAEKHKILECFNCLTTREKEVLRLIVSSHSNKEAAKILNISHRTIDVHRARVMEKMRAENLAELVAMAISHELF